MIEAKVYFAAKSQSQLLDNYNTMSTMVHTIKKRAKRVKAKGKQSEVRKVKVLLGRAKAKLATLSVELFGPASDGSEHGSDSESSGGSSSSR